MAPRFDVSNQQVAEAFGQSEVIASIEGCFLTIDISEDEKAAIDAIYDVCDGKLSEVHVSTDGLFAIYRDSIGTFFEFDWNGAQGEDHQLCTLKGPTHNCPADTFVLTYEKNGGKIIVHSASGVPAKCA